MRVPHRFTAKDVARLEPGDCLLYHTPRSLIACAIMVKTFSPVSHVEVYRGYDHAVASRDRIGVATYPFRHADLYEVLRPINGPLDLTDALAWFDVPFDPLARTGVTGQAYDTWGLFRFFTFGAPSEHKQFCSELATRFYRRCTDAAGRPFKPFAGRYDADLVSPGMFRSSDEFDLVWSAYAGWQVHPA